MTFAKRRLFVIGEGDTASYVAELSAHLGYDEVRLTDDLPEDVVSTDHVVIAEDAPGPGQKILLAAAQARVFPSYLAYAAPHRDGLNAAVRLAYEGLSADRLQRVSAPIGFDLGAETPQEVAILVAAELVAVRRGKWNPTPHAAKRS